MTREEFKQKINNIHTELVFNQIDSHEALGKMLSLTDEYTKPKGKSLKEREQRFRVDVLGYAEQYEISLLDDFIDYWTEHGENDKKMKFEKEKSFGISRRIKTWARNAQRFGTKKNTDQDWNEWINR